MCISQENFESGIHSFFLRASFVAKIVEAAQEGGGGDYRLKPNLVLCSLSCFNFSGVNRHLKVRHELVVIFNS